MEKPAERASMPVLQLFRWSGTATGVITPIEEGQFLELVGDGWTIRVRKSDDGRGLAISTQGCHAGSTKLVVVPRVSNEIHIYNDAARAELIYEEADQIDRARQANKNSPMGSTRRKKK